MSRIKEDWYNILNLITDSINFYANHLKYSYL